MGGSVGGGGFHDPEQPKDGVRGDVEKGDGKSFGMAYNPVKKSKKKKKKKDNYADGSAEVVMRHKTF